MHTGVGLSSGERAIHPESIPEKNFDFFLPSEYQLTRASHVVTGFDEPHFPMKVLLLLGGMGGRWGGGEEEGTGIGM